MTHCPRPHCHGNLQLRELDAPPKTAELACMLCGHGVWLRWTDSRWVRDAGLLPLIGQKQPDAHRLPLGPRGMRL